MTDQKLPAFTAAMKNYFGFRPNTGVGEFAAELRALSFEEKMEFHKMLVEQAGIPCEPPTAPKVA